MTDTTITVQGEHTQWHPAERATVHASVQVDGADRAAVFAAALASSETLRGSVEALHDENDGPITWWSADSVRLWSDRPWNNEGAQLPLVFHAAVDLSAKFSQFDALASWLETAAAIDSVSIGSIAWDLTTATRTAATAEARTGAVQDAVAKATAFAASLGLGAVTPVAIAEPGMLGDPVGVPSPGFARASMKASFDSVGGAPQLGLKPEQIVVSCQVDARFIAR